MKKLYIFCLFFLSQYSYSLNIQPAKYEIFLSTGEFAVLTFNVMNDSLLEKQVNISSKYWFLSEENKNIKLDSWLSFDPEHIKIAPNQQKTVNCKVLVPDNAKGFLNAMLSFTEENKYGPISLMISVPIYVIIKDTTKIDIQISSFSLISNPHQNYLTIGVKNTGNLYFRPRGELNVFRYSKKIYNKGFEDTHPIFPDKEKYLMFEIERFLPGKYTANITFNIWENKIEKNIYFFIDRTSKVKIIEE